MRQIRGFLWLLVRIVGMFVGVLCAVWIILFALHVVVPSHVIAPASPALASIKEQIFARADNFLGRSMDNWPSDDSSLRKSTEILQLCLQGEIDSAGEIPLRAQRVHYAATLLTEELERTINSQQADLNAIRRSSAAFASLLILLGMLTTFVSALNSSEFGSGTTRSASIIKITAIALPAFATAVTAYAALYAPTDLATRKSQLLSQLTTVASEITVILQKAPCPMDDGKDLAKNVEKLEVEISNWTRKYADAVTAANFPQLAAKAPVGAGDGVENTVGITPNDPAPAAAPTGRAAE